MPNLPPFPLPLLTHTGALLILVGCTSNDPEQETKTAGDEAGVSASSGDVTGPVETMANAPSGSAPMTPSDSGSPAVPDPSGSPSAPPTGTPGPGSGPGSDPSEVPAASTPGPISSEPSVEPPITSTDDSAAPAGSTDPPGVGGMGEEVLATEPAIQFIGRFDSSDPAGPRFAWSGSGIVAQFAGSSLSVNLEDSGSNQFAVWIDGTLQPVLDAQSGANEYPLASGLSDASHTVEIYRRTEASQGVSRFLGFDFGPEGNLLPPISHTRRIEVIGDSITCGYGNEGANESCPFSPETENHNQSYAAVTARALEADLSTVAWSGKGIIYNYGEDTVEPLPELYDRAIPSEADSQWDFGFIPDAVVINLGTNDFSTDGDPSPELFRDSYAAFLEHIRSKYPQASILCTVGPMLGGDDLNAARTGIAAAVEVRNAAGDDDVEAWEMDISNDSPGCDWHPSVATHQAMADALTAKLRETLDW